MKTDLQLVSFYKNTLPARFKKVKESKIIRINKNIDDSIQKLEIKRLSLINEVNTKYSKY
jgi:hypothetical protein